MLKTSRFKSSKLNTRVEHWEDQKFENTEHDWTIWSFLPSFILAGLPFLFSCSLVCPPKFCLIFFFLLFAHCVVDFTAPFQQAPDVTFPPVPLTWVFQLVVLRPISERAAVLSLCSACWSDTVFQQQIAFSGPVCESVWLRRRWNRSLIVERDTVNWFINQWDWNIGVAHWWLETARQRRIKKEEND